MSNSPIESTEPKARALEYIDKGIYFIHKDLNELMNAGLQAIFPTILTTFAGIEFMSSLLYHHEVKSKTDRASRYFSEWMAQVNPQFRMKIKTMKLGELLYKKLRCGLSHYANPHGGIVVSGGENKDKHLSATIFWGEKAFFVHGDCLAEEFLQSVELVQEATNNSEDLRNIILHNGEKLEKLFAIDEEIMNELHSRQYISKRELDYHTWILTTQIPDTSLYGTSWQSPSDIKPDKIGGDE